MGIFQHKKKSLSDAAVEIEQQFFDDDFREELREHSRKYFEQIVKDNTQLFKSDLDATVAQVNTDLRAHITDQLDVAIAEIKTDLKGHVVKQIDSQFTEYSTTMKEAHDASLQAMRQDAHTIEQQYKKLTETLQQNVAEQDEMLRTSAEETKAQVGKMRETEGLALQWLAQSVKALQQQHEQLATELQHNVAEQEAALVNVFEQNMAQIIERYLLSALGDQYDLKAQLPSIIKQMETNKQAMVDDMSA